MPLSAPTKIETPFATSGSKNTIPVPSQIGVTPGAASYTDGFPPLTMTPLASGGVPPFGQDFNGVLYEITKAMQWQQAMAGAYAYDSAFATAVGGYPLGAAVLRSDGLGLWINQTANNSTDPEAGGAGWMPLIQPGATSVTMTGSNVTLTSLQAGKDIIIISGTITGNLNLIFPTYVKTWTVVNNTSGAYTITAKTASGTGVAVSGVSAIMGDGTNIIGMSSSIASTAEAQAWADNTKIITPLRLAEAFQGANQTLAATGKQNFPGGLQIKWDYANVSIVGDSGIDITFPTAFPNACIAVFPSFIVTNDQDDSGPSYRNKTSSGFRLCNSLTTGGGSLAPVGYSYLAIGY